MGKALGLTPCSGALPRSSEPHKNWDYLEFLGHVGWQGSRWDAARKSGITWNCWWNDRDAAGMHQRPYLKFLVGCRQGNRDYLELLVEQKAVGMHAGKLGLPGIPGGIESSWDAARKSGITWNF